MWGEPSPEAAGTLRLAVGGPRGHGKPSWVPAGKPGCWWGTGKFSPGGQPQGSVKGQTVGAFGLAGHTASGEAPGVPRRLGSRLRWTRCFCLKRVPVGTPLGLTGTGISDNFHESQNTCLLLIFFLNHLRI